MSIEDDVRELRSRLKEQEARISSLQNSLTGQSQLSDELAGMRQEVGILRDKDEIQRLQYCYGFFLDNRMFREIADLFADQGAWIEIGQRGRYFGKERIHSFLLGVLGDGRWGLLRDEVINHVQQQLLISVDEDRQRARARARAEVQGNSPPTTPHLLLADGIYENEYVREDGQWKILSICVTMTFYAAVQRERVWFASAPPSTTLPPDRPSQPTVPELGRQFNHFHFKHPVKGYDISVPASGLQGGGARATSG